MKRNYIAKILPVIPVMLVVMHSCTGRPVPKSSNHEQIVDSAIALLSKKVNSAIVSEIPPITASRGMRIFSVMVNGSVTYDARSKATISSRVSGRIEKVYVKYNFQPVRKGQLILEIYSPDLAAAQRELVLTARSGDYGLMVKARQRLQLLGMQNEQITDVITSGKIIYRVPVYSNATGYILEQNNSNVNMPTVAKPSQSIAGSAGMGGMDLPSPAPSSSQLPLTYASSPVMVREGQYIAAGQSIFSIYKSETLIAEFALQPEIAARVKKGQKILFGQASDRNSMKVGTFGLIEPVLQGGQSFSSARVYIGTTDLRPGQLLTGYVPVIFNEGYWLPKQAVLRLGSRYVVFKKYGNAYTPYTVNVGATLREDIQVLTDISNWQIAPNAYYLVDSESFIRTKQQQ